MNFPRGLRLLSGSFMVLPEFVGDMMEARYAVKSDKAPNLTIGQWLNAQPRAVQRREGIRVLKKMGMTAC